MPPAAGAGRGRVGPSRPPLPPLVLAVYAASKTSTTTALSRHVFFGFLECNANPFLVLVVPLIIDQFILNEEGGNKKKKSFWPGGVPSGNEEKCPQRFQEPLIGHR